MHRYTVIFGIHPTEYGMVELGTRRVLAETPDAAMAKVRDYYEDKTEDWLDNQGIEYVSGFVAAKGWNAIAGEAA